MRNGRRLLLAMLGASLLGMLASGAPAEPRTEGASAAHLTLEVEWNTPATPAQDAPAVELELTEGQILGAVAVPGGGLPEPIPVAKADAAWALGSGRSGRVRTRVEAPLGASLVVKAGGQSYRFPLLALLEGPQQSPAKGATHVGVERLAWDAIEIRAGEGIDGTAAPGATVPVTVGFNIPMTEPSEVVLKFSAELRPLRGGDLVWRIDRADQVLAAGGQVAPSRALTVQMPKAEGTYKLDVHASWEPSVKPAEGTRIGRWVRRNRKLPAGNSATRSVTLAVVGAKPEAAETVPEAVVDLLDLSRPRGNRPTASGRATAAEPGKAWSVPDAALVEAHLRDRLRGWIVRGENESANLGAAEASGLAWSAFGLRVPHPGRPHRLTVTVVGGHPSALGIALIAPATESGGRPRIVLDACASSPPILEGGAPTTFSWLVWPDAAEPVLVAVNRGSNSPVRLGAVELKELADVPRGPALIEPPGDPGRGLGLVVGGPRGLDRFGGGDGPADPLIQATNLSAYLAHCGASTAVLPEGLADRPARQALDGQAAEDCTGPDRLDLALRVLGRKGLSAWVEARLDGPLPGLPAPDTAAALARGLVRVDRRGKADGPVAAYFPLNPEVRDAMARRVATAIAPRKARPNLSGVLIRLGPGPTLAGTPEAGLDDATFARFLRAMFDPATARGLKGLGPEAPGRFAARAEFLAGAGRSPWLAWRARELGVVYDELAKATRRAAPGALFAVATPGLDAGPIGQEARRADGLGQAPGLAWRALGLDLKAWPTDPGSPIVLRGVGLGEDELGKDLATSPDLDEQVASRPVRGVLLADAETDDEGGALRLNAAPAVDGPAGDEPLGHALAAFDARWAMVSALGAAGQEDRLRRFARVFRALPAPPEGPPTGGRLPAGVAMRSATSGGKSYLAVANDAPYPTVVEAVLDAPSDAALDDLGRGMRLTPESAPGGGKRLVLDLAPFGSAAIRVGAPGVREHAVTPHHPASTRAGLEVQVGDLSARLLRLSRGVPAAGGPPIYGFEPEADVRVVQIQGAPALKGWKALGDASNAAEIDADRPHSGVGSLRLDAKALPASVAGESFLPPGGATIAVQGWLRADRPDTRVRAWIEGEANGVSLARPADLVAQPDWSAITFRAGDLPAGGLQRARLRFEVLSPGRLWIDDVSVSGAALAESDRSNARRTLGAALQAYREGRYADFARLANSRWARRVEAAPATGPNAARPDVRRRRF